MEDIDNWSKPPFSLSLEIASVSFPRPGPTQSLHIEDVAYMMKPYHNPSFMLYLWLHLKHRAYQEVLYDSFLVLEKQFLASLWSFHWLH